jgi:hypothetical protein
MVVLTNVMKLLDANSSSTTLTMVNAFRNLPNQETVVQDMLWKANTICFIKTKLLPPKLISAFHAQTSDLIVSAALKMDATCLTANVLVSVTAKKVASNLQTTISTSNAHALPHAPCIKTARPACQTTV